MSGESEMKKCSLLARVNYPLYSVKTISERHILVAGGGGQSKTGIANTCEIYELIYDPENNTCRANLVTHFDTGNRAIMNVCLVNKSKFNFEIFTGGMDGICNVYEVKLKLTDDENEDCFSYNDTSAPSSASVRRRNFSFNSQHSSEDVEGNSEFDTANHRGANLPNGGDGGGPATAKLKTDSPTTNSQNIPDFVYEFRFKTSFQTDFEKSEPFQKLIKYSPNANMIYSAGADGTIRFWSMPDFTMTTQIKAHDNEVDDIDIHPAGTHLVSVSRDGRNTVWNTFNGKMLTSLDVQQSIPKPKNQNKLALASNAKYICRGCRYGTVEGDQTNVRLFAILNPAVRTKPSLDSYICKWNVHNDKYNIEKFTSTGDVSLSSMCISDNGRFLAVGTLTGDVQVYIAFSLQCCYKVTQAHNIFVTGLEFLPTTPATLELIGGQTESALVSISVDNHIVLHKIPRRASLSFFGSFIIFVLFMFTLYVTMSYFDL